MLELTDATPIADDGPALRARLAEDGYVFFRGLLPRPAVQHLRGSVQGTLDQAGWLNQASTSEHPLPTPAAVREGEPGYFGAYVGIQRLQEFHELAHHDALVSVMARIVDEPLLVHPRKIARTSLPQDDEYTPPHQDYRLIQGTVDTFTAWVPLGDCPRTLGGLRMLAGSHRGGLMRAAASTAPGGMTLDVDDDDPAWRTTDYRSGDVLVFSSLTVHGALRNDEERMRFSADFRYQSLLEPVVSGSLDPHYSPSVPGWDDLTTGWSSLASVQAPEGTVLAEMRPPLDVDLEAPASRLLSVA